MFDINCTSLHAHKQFLLVPHKKSLGAHAYQCGWAVTTLPAWSTTAVIWVINIGSWDLGAIEIIMQSNALKGNHSLQFSAYSAFPTHYLHQLYAGSDSGFWDGLYNFKQRMLHINEVLRNFRRLLLIWNEHTSSPTSHNWWAVGLLHVMLLTILLLEYKAELNP